MKLLSLEQSLEKLTIKEISPNPNYNMDNIWNDMVSFLIDYVYNYHVSYYRSQKKIEKYCQIEKRRHQTKAFASTSIVL